MNEQIKDLAEQANIYFREVEFSGEVLSDGEVDFEDLEKFAKLIVRKCMSMHDEPGVYTKTDMFEAIACNFRIEG